MNTMYIAMRANSDNCSLGMGKVLSIELKHSIYREIDTKEVNTLVEDNAILKRIFSERHINDLVNTLLDEQETDSPRRVFESFSIDGVSLKGEEVTLVLEISAYTTRDSGTIVRPEREWNLTFKTTVLTKEDRELKVYRQGSDFEVNTQLKPLYEYAGFEKVLSELEEYFLEEFTEDNRLIQHSAEYEYCFGNGITVTVSYDCLESVTLPSRKYLVFRDDGKIATFYTESALKAYFDGSEVVRGITLPSLQWF